MTSYSREEVETYLEIFNSVVDAMAAGWKEGDAGLAVERRLLADLTSIIQDFWACVNLSSSSDISILVIFVYS